MGKAVLLAFRHKNCFTVDYEIKFPKRGCGKNCKTCTHIQRGHFNTLEPKQAVVLSVEGRADHQ